MKSFSISVLVFGSMTAGMPLASARGDVVPGSRYTSGRGAALGDAMIPLADDGASALFYNPAGIGKIRKSTLEVANFQLQSNTDFSRMLNRNFMNVASLPGFKPTLIQKSGAFPGVGGAFLPNFYTRGFAFGMLAQGRLAAKYYHDGAIHYRTKVQMIPSIGTGVRLASGVVRLGYSFQWVNQSVGDRVVSADDPNLGYSDGIYQGSAMSHNLGVALSLPIALLPSLNIVARNVGGAKFSSLSLLPIATNSAGAPPAEPMSIDLALSGAPRIGRGGFVNMVLEVRDATNTSSMPIMTRLALGMEFSFKDTFFLRGGFGGGYPSAGIGLRRPKRELSISWYSEETGRGFRSERDIRYMLHYQVRAF